jgi:hypothetical protein
MSEFFVRATHPSSNRLAQFLISRAGLLLLTVPSGAERLYVAAYCSLQGDPQLDIASSTPKEWLFKTQFFHYVDRIPLPQLLPVDTHN